MVLGHTRYRPAQNRSDYSRDLRPAKWGSMVILHGTNFKPSMSALGQKRTSQRINVMSALPPKADIGTHSRDVCFVPKADMGPKPKRTKMCTKMNPGHSRGFRRIGYRNNIRRRRCVQVRSQMPGLLQTRSNSMGARIVRCLVHATAASFASALVLVAVPGPALTGDQPIPSEEQKQTDFSNLRANVTFVLSVTF